MCHTFSESGPRGQQNVGSGILIFGPRPEKTGPEGGAGRGADKIFGISTFFIKGTPAKIGRQSFSVLCNFLIRRTPRAPRVPRGPGGVKIKSQNWVIFYRRDPPQNQILRTFCFIQPFDKTQPRGPIWEFGGSSEWNKAFQSILNLLPMILDIGGLRAVDFLGGSPFTCKVSARQPEAACRSSPCTDLHKHSLASIAQGVGGYGLKHMS